MEKMLLGCFILITLLTSSHSILEELEDKFSYKVEARAIAIEVINTIIKRSNDTFSSNETLFNECYDMIKGDLINGTFSQIVYNSGHGLMKIGNQKDCEEEDYTYHLFSLSIKPETLDSPNEDLNEFIGLTSYYIGLCLWKKCTNVVQALIDKRTNPCLFAFFFEYKNITDVSQYNTKTDMALSRRFYVTFLFCLVPFLGFRIFLSWINDLFLDDENEDEEKLRRQQLEIHQLNESLHSSMMAEYADLNKSIGKVKDNKDKDIEKSSSHISSESLFKEYGEKNDNSEIENLEKYMNKNFPRQNKHCPSNNKQITCQSIFGSLIDFFLGKISHKNLFNSTNSIFNESGIEILSGLRAFHMVFATIFRVFNTFYKVPSTSYGNLDFYNSYNLGIIKYASFSLYSWIYLDGFLYCYKLMFSLKKHKKESLPLSFYVKFVLWSALPKLFVFLIIFYAFMLNMNSFAVLYGKTLLFQKHYDETWSNYKCVANPSLMLIPFYFSYFSKNSCFDLVVMVLNEFYCFVFVIALFYIMYKLKNNRFDIAVMVLFLLNMILSFLSYREYYENDAGAKYTFGAFLGEGLTLIYPHLMFNIFFLGVLCGLLYFYYKESVSDFQNYLQKSFYYPFKFCFFLMTLLSKLKKIARYALLSISFLSQLLLSFLYPLLKNYYLTERTFLFSFSVGFRMVCIYEKLIYTFFFALICLMILFSSDKLWLKIIFRSKIFLTVSRVSFAFVLFSEVFIYLFYTLFDMSGIFWNYQNVWYISCVLCIGLLFLAELCTVYIEIPIRMLIKDYCKDKEDERKKPGVKAKAPKKELSFD